MPIHKVGSEWQWGQHGKKYPTRKQAEEQAAAAHAHGYHGDDVSLIDELAALWERIKQSFASKDIADERPEEPAPQEIQPVVSEMPEQEPADNSHADEYRKTAEQSAHKAKIASVKAAWDRFNYEKAK